MHRALRYTIAMPALLCTGLVLYIIAWSIWYRLPAAAPEMIDLRAHTTDRSYYVVLCSALADNPCGFPGHCYAAWSEHQPTDILALDSAGFVPAHASDQILSLWSKVPSAVVHRAARGNTRHLDALVIIVDSAKYKQTERIEDNWNHRQFQAGVSDCVAFVNDIATSLSIKTPPMSYKFPQDYIRELKALNRDRGTQSLAFQQLVPGASKSH